MDGRHASDRAPAGDARMAAGSRYVYADNLKVTLVRGVIVAHVTMVWTALEGAWVFSEPPVREPLLSP